MKAEMQVAQLSGHLRGWGDVGVVTVPVVILSLFTSSVEFGLVGVHNSNPSVAVNNSTKLTPPI